MFMLRTNGAVILSLAYLVLSVPSAFAQDPPAPGPGTIYVVADPVVIGATVPCDSAAYTLSEDAPVEGKAYTARSFGGSACTTSLNFEVPHDFTATEPITIRAVLACDTPAASGGVEGATTSVRFIVDHDGEALTGNINLVGSNTCDSAPLVFQATADLEGEEFSAGDILTVRVIPFYTTGGAGDPNKSLHLLTGGADPSVVVVPDLAVGGGGSGEAPPLYQNVTSPELRTGRNATENLTQVEVYNWTATQESQLSYDAEVIAGEVRIAVTDALDETRLDLTVDATGNASSAIGAGNLTLRIEYVNFTGDFVVKLAAAAPGSETQSSTSVSASTSGTANDDDRTGTFPLSPEEQTPGPGPFSVVALLAVIAIACRRRLQ